MKPIRVLLHLDRLGMGGMEKKVVQLAARLNRERFEPVVSYSGKSGPCAAELRKAGIRSLKIVPHPPGHPRAEIAVRQIRDIAPDLFHSFSCSESSDDVVSAHRAGVPAILTGRDNVRHWTSGPVKDWECVRNSLTAFVTPCCEAAAKLCRDVEGIPPEKIDVILNGVELPSAAHERSIRQELNLPDDTILAGYAARYEYLKGHEGLISAWWGVVNRHPNVHLVCCGEYDEPRMSRVRQTVAEHSLEHHITLLGPRVKTASFYRGLDMYVHPSHSEALSMAILEAMSHGQPVVAFAVGGTPEAVIHDETGILAAPKDDFALRHAMLRLIEDPVTRKKFGAAGRQRIEEHFSVERMVQAYESLYLRVVDRQPSSSSPRTRLQFTGAPGSPTLDDTTVFLTTTGDDTGLEECIERLQAQTVRCSVVWIDGVDSLPAALNRMHTLCTSPYYVWVTGEMLLAPHAIEHLRGSLDGSPPDVARVSAPLWDHEMGEPVPAITIHRHAIVQQFPYEDILGCEALQSVRMQAAGFLQLVLSPDNVACLGEFGKHGSPEDLFRRWQWSFQRHNRHGHAQWLDPWPQRLLDRYIESRDLRHLYAFLGAVAGIAVKTDGSRELDWREADPALHRMRYYFPQKS